MKKTFLIISAILVCNFSQAAEMTCERYIVKDSKKADLSSFTFKTSSDSSITYTLITGKGLPISSNPNFKNIWQSKNGLRYVASFINTDYETKPVTGHPVYILDIDFAKNLYQLKTAGGFTDFDQVIHSPWQTSCQRND